LSSASINFNFNGADHVQTFDISFQNEAGRAEHACSHFLSDTHTNCWTMGVSFSSLFLQTKKFIALSISMSTLSLLSLSLSFFLTNAFWPCLPRQGYCV